MSKNITIKKTFCDKIDDIPHFLALPSKNNIILFGFVGITYFKLLYLKW